MAISLLVLLRTLTCLASTGSAHWCHDEWSLHFDKQARDKGMNSTAVGGVFSPRMLIKKKSRNTKAPTVKEQANTSQQHTQISAFLFQLLLKSKWLACQLISSLPGDKIAVLGVGQLLSISVQLLASKTATMLTQQKNTGDGAKLPPLERLNVSSHWGADS